MSKRRPKREKTQTPKPAPRKGPPLKYNDCNELLVGHLPPPAVMGLIRDIRFLDLPDNPGTTGKPRAQAFHPITGYGQVTVNWGDRDSFDDDRRRAMETDVRAQLLRAGETLGRCPMPREVRGLEQVVHAVEVIRSRNDHGAYDKDEEVRRRPTSQEISELDQTLQWLLWLEAPRRQAVWCFMVGVSLRKAAKEIGGMSHEGVRKLLHAGIDQIVGWVLEGRT